MSSSKGKLIPQHKQATTQSLNNFTRYQCTCIIARIFSQELTKFLNLDAAVAAEATIHYLH